MNATPRHPLHLLASSVALAGGAGLATFALRRTRFEPTSAGLYNTPHGPIGITLAVLFAARLVRWRRRVLRAKHEREQAIGHAAQ
ncbi:MAG: hypothetical protein U1F67_22420 [Rubrivivax sp.]